MATVDSKSLSNAKTGGPNIRNFTVSQTHSFVALSSSASESLFFYEIGELLFDAGACCLVG